MKTQKDYDGSLCQIFVKMYLFKHTYCGTHI